MKRKTIKKVIDGIERKIVTKTDIITSHIEFFENKELQLIIDIPEDVIHLEPSKLKRRKYAVIFNYYLDKGIQDLSYEDIESMINTKRIECDIEFVFHNKNGINIGIKENEGSFLNRDAIASYQETINGVCFEIKSVIVQLCFESLKYHELNELDKPNDIERTSHWKRSILCEPYLNEYEEKCVTIEVDGISYSMLEAMYNRLNNVRYLDSRNFFEEGSTLFDITEEQNRLLTKNIVLNRQKGNFIKYIDFDGSIVV